jgi:RNA-directed DNA polymerase
VNWVLDADIRGFFDNLSHEWTMKFIKHRAADSLITATFSTPTSDFAH